MKLTQITETTNIHNQRMVKMLLLYAPGPLGLGKTKSEIARDLGICQKTVHRWFRKFQNRYPVSNNKLMSMRASMERQGQSLRTKVFHGGTGLGRLIYDLKIVEKF